MTEFRDGNTSERRLKTAEEKGAHDKNLRETQQAKKPDIVRGVSTSPAAVEVVFTNPFQKNKTEVAEKAQRSPETEGIRQSRLPDGTLLIEKPNGTKKFQRPDGTIEIEKPNLVKSTIKPDGTIVINRPNGLNTTISKTKEGKTSIAEELGGLSVTTTNGDVVHRKFATGASLMILGSADTLAKDLKAEALDEGDGWKITTLGDGTKIIKEGYSFRPSRINMDFDGQTTTMHADGTLTIDDIAIKWKTLEDGTVIGTDARFKLDIEEYRVDKDGSGISLQDGKFHKDKDGNLVSEQNGIKVTTKPDHTVIEENTDHSIVTTRFSDGRMQKSTKYSEGGYLEISWLEPLESGRILRTNLCSRDLGIAKELALKKMEDLRDRFPGVSFSTDSDNTQTPPLALLKSIESALERSQVAHMGGLKFTFSKEKESNIRAYVDSPNKQVVLASDALEDHKLDPNIDDTVPYVKSRKLVDMIGHELGHKSTHVRYGKWGSELPLPIIRELAHNNGFAEIIDITDGNRTIFVSKAIQSKDRTSPATMAASKPSFDLFKPLHIAFDKVDLIRCNQNGEKIDQSYLSYEEFQAKALVALPTPFAQTHPMEADAEGFALLRRGTDSRRLLIRTRSKSDEERIPKFYREKVDADAKEIDMAHPPSQEHPNGLMRTVSGQLVDKTPENLRILMEWERQNSRD